MSAVNIHSPGEKRCACSVNYTVRCELWGSKQPDPTVVGETMEQWLQSAFPATICVVLLTIKHLSITPRLQLLAHHATDSKVGWIGYCFVSLTLTQEGFLNAIKLLDGLFFFGLFVFFLWLDGHICHYSADYSCFWNVLSVYETLFSLLFPWLYSSHGFCKHAREQYEKLSTMHKNMQKLYESIGTYFAFDPHSVSVEDFFGELANFRILFMVSIKFLFYVNVHEKLHVSCPF